MTSRSSRARSSVLTVRALRAVAADTAVPGRSRGLPKRTPRDLAAARAAFVRSDIAFRDSQGNTREATPSGLGRSPSLLARLGGIVVRHHAFACGSRGLRRRIHGRGNSGGASARCARRIPKRTAHTSPTDSGRTHRAVPAMPTPAHRQRPGTRMIRRQRAGP